MKRCILLTLCCLAASLATGGTAASTEAEIQHLLTFVKESGCTFERNGREYASRKAFEHINKKYRYVSDKGMVDTAEDFIEYSATKSSMSGGRYHVVCDGSRRSSAEWLLTELARFREGQL